MALAISSQLARAAFRRTGAPVASSSRQLFRPPLSVAWFSSEAPKFDEEMVKIYNKMSSNHTHVNGPWNMMSAVILQEYAAMESPSILDLASGPGEPALTIAKLKPQAHVVATDVSEDMVASALKASDGLSNFRAEVADAQALKYEDNSFDAVTCCYGYMFPSDKMLALQETLRVLKPGGILVATTWDQVDMIPLSMDIMTEVLGKKPDPLPLDPMALAEPGLFSGMVSEAGFVGITQETSTYPFDFGSGDFPFKVATILLRMQLNELGDDAWKKAETAYLAKKDKYIETRDDGVVILPNNTFRLTVARKPAA